MSVTNTFNHLAGKMIRHIEMEEKLMQTGLFDRHMMSILEEKTVNDSYIDASVVEGLSEVLDKAQTGSEALQALLTISETTVKSTYHDAQKLAQILAASKPAIYAPVFNAVIKAVEECTDHKDKLTLVEGQTALEGLAKKLEAKFSR